MTIKSVKIEKPVIRTTDNTSGYSQKCFVQFDSPLNVDTRLALVASDGTHSVPTAPMVIDRLAYVITGKATSINHSVVTVDITWDLFNGSSPTKTGSIWHTKLSVDGVDYEDYLKNKDYSNPQKIIGVNTAGDRMNTAIKVYRNIRVYHITYKAADFPEEQYEELVGKTNDSAITLSIWGREKVFGPNTLLLKRAAHSLDYESDTDESEQLVTYPYWAVDLELHYKKDGWIWKQESVGFREKVSGDMKEIYLPKTDGSKSQVRPTNPWPLDANGKALTNNTDTGFIIEYQPYQKTSFAVLEGITFELYGDEV